MNKTIILNISPFSLNEKISFFTEFSTYIKSSIPITTLLAQIIKYSPNSKIKKISSYILHSIDNGTSFSKAVLKLENILGAAYCNLLAVGEQSGNLPEITKDILTSLKKQRTIRSNIIKSSAYPAIIMLFVIIAVLVLIFFIVPKVYMQAEMMTTNIPLLMKILNVISKFMIKTWVLLLIAIPFIISFFIKQIKNAFKNAKILNIPLIGKAVKLYNLSVFSRIFSITYSSGITVTNGYIISSKAVTNNYIKNSLLSKAQMLSNTSISKTFEATKLFTPQMLSSIEAGEISGHIDEMLKEISNDIDEMLDTAISVTLEALGPILLVIVAIFVFVFGYIIMGPANPFNYL